MKDNYLVRCPVTGKVYLTNNESLSLYGYNGSPICKRARHESWERVNTRTVPSLFCWQHAPGYHGPDYLVVEVTPRQGCRFTAGGKKVVIDNWCEDHDATWDRATAVLYATRNAARANAEVKW